MGDAFDSRLMIILHEHWWRWVNGLVSLRDTEFFYPFDMALGYSDVFLTQGILYSFLRLIGYGLAPAWTLTTILLLIIGNLGWVFVARKYIKSYALQVLLVLTLISSLSFVQYFTYIPNIVGYSYLSWISLFINNIINEKDSIRKNKKLAIFGTLMLVYALSCWYGAFFVMLLILFRIFFEVMFNYKTLNSKIKEFRFRQNTKQYLVQSPIQLFLIWLFIYVYVSVANQPNRPTDEMIGNSPRINLLPNGSNFDGTKLSGSIFEDFYIKLGLDFEKEYGVGIGAMSLILGIIIAVYGVTKNLFNKNQKLWIMTFLGVYLYFVVYAEKFSFHQIFFENIPGFNSIRCPSRFVILLGFFIIFGIYFTFDAMLQKSNKFKVVFIILSLLLVLDQYRAPFKGWDPSVLINTDLMSQKDEIKKNCDYFYYDFPGGWWYDQIEAMTFAIQVGVPTVNGYTGAFPPDYPTEDFTSTEEPFKIFEWIDKIDKNLRGCFVTGRSEIKDLNKPLNSIDFVGFSARETNGKESWNWAVSPNPYLYILSNEFKNKKITFEITTNSCDPVQQFQFLDGQNNKLTEEIQILKTNRVEIDLNMEKSFVKRLQIITDGNGCKISGDERELFFELKNLEYTN